MTPPAHRDVVVALYQQTWGNAAARNYSYSPDRIVWGLSTDPELDSLLVADPVRSRLGLWRDRQGRADLPGGMPERRLVQPARWSRAWPRDQRRMISRVERLDRWLRARRRSEDALLVTCNPLLAAVADRRSWADVVYYGWDEWAAFGWAASGPLGHLRGQVLWAYEQMAEHDVKVVAVTRAIVDRIGAPRGFVVPNGIAATDFDDLTPPPDWFARIPGRVALYAGSLEDRIDVAALEACARELGDGWTLVLVGPMQAPEWFQRLRDRPNVVIGEPLARSTVLAMMAASDVGLVCHRDTPLTRAMSPLKLYEYLAAGTPVVATDLEPMRGVSSRCLLVPDGGHWASAVRHAASLGRDTGESLARFREQHDWAHRYQEWRQAALTRDATTGSPRPQRGPADDVRPGYHRVSPRGSSDAEGPVS